MSDQDIRIVQLQPLRAASAHAYGTQPEIEALAKLKGWARAKGYLDHPEGYRIFGFNNPDPSPGSPNYGYEVWLTIDAQAEPEGEIEIKEFSGGLYAVLSWDGAGDPYEAIPAAWHELVKWREERPYQPGAHQWLEEHLPLDETDTVPFKLDLFLPIEEGS
jgi:DNA gyrase inhibitor GyrI